jgi:hypothetical protein
VVIYRAKIGPNLLLLPAAVLLQLILLIGLALLLSSLNVDNPLRPHPLWNWWPPAFRRSPSCRLGPRAPSDHDELLRSGGAYARLYAAQLAEAMAPVD